LGLTALGDVPNLKPLRSFVAYGSSSGDRSTFAAFLEIKVISGFQTIK